MSYYHIFLNHSELFGAGYSAARSKVRWSRLLNLRPAYLINQHISRVLLTFDLDFGLADFPDLTDLADLADDLPDLGDFSDARLAALPIFSSAVGSCIMMVGFRPLC